MRKTASEKIKRWVLVAGVIMILVSAPSVCFSKNVSQAVASINSPEDLSRWFSQAFTYETEMPDYWQTSEETIERKRGDCEDFAILAQSILKRIGIKSDIVIVKFQGLSQEHAICIFKTGETISFISNQQLVKTYATSVTGAMDEQYPDWESITYTNADKEVIKTVLKTDCSSPLGHVFDTASKNK